jgi:phytoene/squalene synthetase
MINLYNTTSAQCSQVITQAYSTSFSLGVKLLAERLQNPIYSIYGFVRLADEIVDTFHEHDKNQLLAEFKNSAFEAIKDGISLNPVLHSFQLTVNKYKIDHELILKFIESMEMDITVKDHTENSFNEYVLGSAEVVGLMCLKIFCEEDENRYNVLKPSAMKLGAAFQKVNFLRDVQNDYELLGRNYFPDVSFSSFSNASKLKIELEIEMDFKEALTGIKKLPVSSRFGVYVAYVYFKCLLNKIKSVPHNKIMKQRVRVPNQQKYMLLLGSFVRHKLNII